MPEQIENRMVVDWWWGEIEYGVSAQEEISEEEDDDDEQRISRTCGSKQIAVV